ncbi:thioesterase family protein [Gloeocapsa sp. PCC 73106]|uniref:acyl-CoA thioesterase n=1 Tax=Gloeocapsa sp. PCC 73106 TaxID=102232 RepID=UPI0002AC1023|nr:thioesterase family protein [Gloeocapsa sp. PCC 73106]ELR97306.1 putative thioesterase [Gloeocapsa sp. PCC 73106]
MSYTYRRVIYLGDTDAAGVIYFAKLLAICHEAYEDWLTQAGINFGELVSNSSVAIPVVHAEIDFLRPIFCAEELLIQIMTEPMTRDSFSLNYEVFKNQELVARAITKHVAIEAVTRRRTSLPSNIVECLKTKAQ